MQMLIIRRPLVIEKLLEHDRIVTDTVALIGGQDDYAEACFAGDEPFREMGFIVPVRLNAQEVLSMARSLSPLDVVIEQQTWEDDDA